MIMKQVPFIGEYWAPILEKINSYINYSGQPNAEVTVPLAVVLALLFSWLLIRLVRARRQGADISEEVSAKSIDKTDVSEDLEDEDESEPDFMVETGELESFDEEPLPDEQQDLVDDSSFEPEELEEFEKPEPVLEQEEKVPLPEPKPEPEPEPEIQAEAVTPLEPADAQEAPEVEAFEPLEGEIVAEEPTLEELAEEEEEVPEEPKVSWFQRLRNGLQKTKDGFVGKIEKILSSSTEIDDDLYDDLEEALVTSDIGVQTAYSLLEATQEQVDEQGIEDPLKIMEILREQVKTKLDVDAPEIDVASKSPYVLMVVGVNGAGKTTTIGKLASKYQKEGFKVMVAAADTFRAAAIEQLEAWANRVGCDIIKQKQGSDPAAVAYDALDAAIARGTDLVIIDTAGRLHTKTNLMAELGKIKRVIQKKVPDGPHQTFLVLDATTGQNAIHQAKEFNKATELSGLILTKLDGTAKGGCIVGIADELKLPIRFIGIGEKIDDLRPFDADDFVKALF